MEENKNYAKFRISISELEISGPAEFVKDQIQFNKNIVDFFAEGLKAGMLLNNDNNNNNNTSKSLEPFNAENGNSSMPKQSEDFAEFVEVKDQSNVLDKYCDIIAVNNDKVQVLSDIPGGSKGAKMLNLLLIYLFIKVKAFSIEKVPSSELRDFCEMHGELDAGHFADYLKKNKKWFLLEGTGKATYVRLTVPGIKDAERLLSTMNT